MSIKINVPAVAELEERQRVEDERAYLTGATGVAYLPTEDALMIRMQSGTAVQIPRRFIDEIATASQETLQNEPRLELSATSYRYVRLTLTFRSWGSCAMFSA